MSKATAKSAAAVKLQPILDLTAAGPLQAELQSHRGRPVSVDASDVERVGALCLQVLLSAHKTWDQEGIRLTFGPASPGFEQGLETMGASFLMTSAGEGVKQ